MRSYDPDEDGPGSEADPEAGVDLHEGDGVDVAATLELLDRVTGDLPGGGERRDGQRAMAEAVATALARRRPLAVQAGTGVGKSLAYLVPAATVRGRVVVATATKNLQDQLATKDAPQVAAHVRGLRVEVLKGRQNYLCRFRARDVGGGAVFDLDSGERAPRGVVDQVRRVLRWADGTPSGDLDDVGFELDGRARRMLSVTPQECLTRARCPEGANCFAELARDRAAESDVLIVNTHLYASHLASGSMLLPAHDYLVLDEAHEAPDIFATLLGTTVNPSALRAVAALARATLAPDPPAEADALAAVADRLGAHLEVQFAEGRLRGLDEGAVRELDAARALVTALVEALRGLDAAGPDGEFRRTRALGPATHLAGDLARLTQVGEDELVFLSRRDREVDVELSLVEVGPRLSSELWGEVTGVLTSATLPPTLPARLGLAGARRLEVASPFDYRGHALLYVPGDFPGRNEDGAEAAIVEELVALIAAAGGRTLALFTNRAVMGRVADAVARRVPTEVLVQGTLSRARLIEEFRASPEASLFAVTSFWQGVDVPGHSLSLVTIDRLPFSVPGDPLAEARRERSANPFTEVDLPRVAMLLAQGVGRLIRTREDRGVVAVLDTRLAEASYRGRIFPQLPPMRRTRDRAEVIDFLGALRAAAEEGT